MFKSMLNSFSMSGIYLKEYGLRLRIVSHGEEISASVVNEEGRIITIIEVPAKKIHATNILNRVVLLSENHRDTEFYRIMAIAVAQEENIGNVNIQFDPNGGGGRTTSDEYSYIQSQNERICLCIVDSDAKYPGSRPGDTAKAVLSLDDPSRPLSRIVITTSMEIENLIPTIVIKDYLGDKNPLRVALDVYEKINENGFTTARLHVDVKNGLRLRELIDKPENSPYYAYWKPVAEAILETEVNPGVCHVDASCDRRSCTCVVIPHLGSNILEQTLPIMRTYLGRQFVQWLDDVMVDEWKRVGRLVIDWCCGSSPKAG